ncbi:MAG: GNAT family N-acetyltransferase [Alphaproteobacteria bacterium]|nr:GNAT family N-acetyltransferase [Alphaproteobacteria bacterium]
MQQFILAKPFPDFIMGEEIFLQIHRAEDDVRIAELVNMVNTNDDFSKYLDLKHYSNIESAKKTAKQREAFAKQGMLADYAIQLFNGKTIGGMCFINRGDKSVGVSYYIDKKYRGKGFVSKALKLAEPEMLKAGFDTIVLEINETNKKSILVANRNNYVLQETGFSMKDFVKNLTQKQY